jgi:NitT/TauT family transport system ATP-binding protein
MVLITHQLNEAVFLSDRILVLSRRPGRIVFEEKIEAPLPRPNEFLYTPQFLAHVDRIRRKIEH